MIRRRWACQRGLDIMVLLSLCAAVALITSRARTYTHTDGQERLEPTGVSGLVQDDRGLINHIRHRILAPSTLPYNLTHPEKEHFSQYGQTQYLLREILHDMRDGFFVEAGAVDGEYLSNSLYLERRLGWTGLLVEAFPGTFAQLATKHRKAYAIQAALSLTTQASEIVFQTDGPRGVRGHIETGERENGEKGRKGRGKKEGGGKKGGGGGRKEVEGGVRVEAYPLYSILRALNVTVIDFLSLDIEGAELKVLKTVPWDELKIRVMCVESNHIPEGANQLISYMQSRGYRYIGTKGIDAWFGWPQLLDPVMKKPN